MLRIDRYIMQRFLIGIIPALLLLLALFSFMVLAEELEAQKQGQPGPISTFWNHVAMTSSREWNQHKLGVFS